MLQKKNLGKVVVWVINLYLYIYYLVNKPIFIFSVSIASPPQLAGASFGGTPEEIGGTGGNGGFNFPNILLVLKTIFSYFLLFIVIKISVLEYG